MTDYEALAADIESSPSKTNWEEVARGVESPSQFHGPREVSQETEGAADISDVAAASLANDPKAQIRFYSEQMGIPEDRFGIVEGQIAYANEDGSLQAVDPGAIRSFVKGVGPSLPAVGGTLGTIGAGAALSWTGPPALLAAAGGGVAGASGGQAVREGLANVFIGDQEISPERIIMEGTIDLAATTAGLLIGKGLTRAAATNAAKEFTAAMKGGKRAAADALKTTLDKVNKQYGTSIKLTPAEISDSAALRSQQMALGNDPKVGQQMEDFAVARGRESESAAGQFFKDISPQADRDAAGEALSGAADTAMKAIKAERVAKGSPVYQTAFREADSMGGVDITPAIAKLDDVVKRFPPSSKILKDIRKKMFEKMDAGEGKTVDVAITDLALIQDSIKEPLDDAISKAARKGANKLAGRLRQVQEELLSTLDSQVPTFKQARALWGDLSAPVTRAEGGSLPMLANKTEKDFEYLGGRFFGSASPAEIRRAKRRIIATEGGEDAWNSALRGFMESRWEQAGRIYKSTIGRVDIGKAAQPASFWANLAGDPSQRMRMDAAMSPLQVTAFDNLMDVFKASGRALNFNSTTAAQLAGREAIKGSGAMKTAAATAVDPIGVFRRAGAGVEKAFDSMNAQTLVDVITTTDSVKELLKVGSRNTTRDKAVLLVAKAINLARTQATSGPSSRDDFLPPSLAPR